MTDKHLITPPPELMQQWLGNHFGTTISGEVSDVELAIATQAARWGADKELEACCMWITREKSVLVAEELGIARRPKLPSLKEQALDELTSAERLYPADWSTVRRALEALPND
jgi:hypothetical protein